MCFKTPTPIVFYVRLHTIYTTVLLYVHYLYIYIYIYNYKCVVCVCYHVSIALLKMNIKGRCYKLMLQPTPL